MRITMDCGLDRAEFEVADDHLIPGPQPPAALPDPAAAVRAALEQPHGFPALRRALTPDDHVAIVVDEHLPHFVALLVPLLEHVHSAGVAPEAMTLLCPPSSRQTWIDDLPDAFEDVQVEVHDPTDRRRLAYLGANRKGKRLYLNRTLVDADQIVVLSERHYDPLLGYSGAEGALYPAFSDQDTRTEMSQRVHLGPPEEKPWRARREATETAWLLGASTFFVQIIEGAGDRVAHVVAGAAEASREGQRLLDACWRAQVPRAADLVIAGVSGDSSRHTFATLAAALACAARVVLPGGRIVLLSQANPALGSEADLLLGAEDPQAVLQQLRGKHSVELVPILQWAGAANCANINLLSGLPDEMVEELFATPLHQAREVQRLLDASSSCLFLPDAHKMLAVV